MRANLIKTLMLGLLWCGVVHGQSRQPAQESTVDPRIAALVRSLSLPGSHLEALRSLLAEKERAAPAVPALATLLNNKEADEKEAVLAVEVLSNLDPGNHEAFLALRKAAETYRAPVQKAALEGLAHFPDFWEESIGWVLAVIQNSGENSWAARGTLGTLALPALPVFVKRLSEPARRFQVLSDINTIIGSTTGREEIKRILAEHQLDMIRILETAAEDRRVTTLASLILYYIDTPEAKASLAASTTRIKAVEAKVAADRERRETTAQTLEQIKAPIARSQDSSEELRSQSVEDVISTDDRFLISIHRAANMDSRLELWQKRGDKYLFFRSLDVEGGVSDVGRWELFQFKGNTFLHVPIYYSGTGMHREDHFFRVDFPKSSFDEVKYLNAVQEFKRQPSEYIRKGEQLEISDDSIQFMFFLWRDDAPPGTGITDGVKGTYTIKQDESGAWIMRSEDMRRLSELNP
jgi:hypothetical protein